MSESWSPEAETWGEFSERARAAFEEDLQAFKGDLSQELRDEGWVSSKLRTSSSRDSKEHFEWLIDYQVRGLNFTKIARQRGVGSEEFGAYDHTGRATVTKSIRKAAQMIDLSL